MRTGFRPDHRVDREGGCRGIDHIYLHQIGDPLDGFIEFWRDEYVPRSRGSDGALDLGTVLAALRDAHLISDRRHTRTPLTNRIS